MSENLRFEIELEDMYLRNGENNSENSPERLYRVKGFNTLVFDEVGLKKLKRVSKLNKSDYEKGFAEGREAALREMREFITGKVYCKSDGGCKCKKDSCHKSSSGDKSSVGHESDFDKMDSETRHEIFDHFYGNLFSIFDDFGNTFSVFSDD